MDNTSLDSTWDTGDLDEGFRSRADSRGASSVTELRRALARAIASDQLELAISHTLEIARLLTDEQRRWTAVVAIEDTLAAISRRPIVSIDRVIAATSVWRLHLTLAALRSDVTDRYSVAGAAS